MKIAHSILRYYPAMGGVEEYVRSLAEGLVKRGHTLKVCTTDLELERKGRIINPLLEFNGVNILRRRPFPISPKGYVLGGGFLGALAKVDADLIHGHVYMHYPADVALIMSRLRHRPFVFNPYFVSLGGLSFCKRIYRSLIGKFLMRADATVVISHFEEEIIRKSGFNFRRLEYIPPGIDLSEFDSVQHNVYQEFNIKTENIVLFTGRIDYNKGIDLLLEAAHLVLREIPETTFFVVGPDWGYLESAKRRLAELKLSNKFIFSGPLSRSDLLSAYKNATIFAFPSRYELFGIVLIEAMAAGLPIVASDSSAIPHILNAGRNGRLFENGDYFSLARQIINLLRDASLRAVFSAAGKSLVKEQYLLSNSVLALEKLYMDLCA